eukprot:403367062
MDNPQASRNLLNQSLLDKSSYNLNLNVSLPQIKGASHSQDRYGRSNTHSVLNQSVSELRKSESRFSRNPHAKFDQSINNISVSDMIRQSRNQSSFGIDGYYVPDNQAHLEKPKTFLITQSKNNDFISQVQKQTRDLPAPNQYETQVNLLMKKNISIYKKKRTSFTDDLIKASKQTPGVGHYQLIKKPKIKGCYKQTLERISCMDEAMYASLQVPGHYPTPKIELFKPKTSAFKIRNETQMEKDLRKRDVERKNDPSPVTYKTEDAWKKTQAPKLGNYVSKSKNLKFTDIVQKNNKGMPSVGQYDVEKSLDRISKPKGWK